ncbi:MAG: nucleoside triphosphate pyrophosphatase [Gammaproteobacteria bacterium]
MFIYLASQSPRRRELLRQIGVSFETLAVEVDERPLANEPAEDFVRRLALEKARAGRRQISGEVPVLGADTAVVVEGAILGKPADRQEALAMLDALSGRTHRVLTGVALVSGTHEAFRMSETAVTFRTLSAREREAYWASGEPADKAGAYALQGLAALFVTRIEGSYSGVVGLPLYETGELLREFGLYWVDSSQQK